MRRNLLLTVSACVLIAPALARAEPVTLGDLRERGIDLEALREVAREEFLAPEDAAPEDAAGPGALRLRRFSGDELARALGPEAARVLEGSRLVPGAIPRSAPGDAAEAPSAEDTPADAAAADEAVTAAATAYEVARRQPFAASHGATTAFIRLAERRAAAEAAAGAEGVDAMSPMESVAFNMFCTLFVDEPGPGSFKSCSAGMAGLATDPGAYELPDEATLEAAAGGERTPPENGEGLVERGGGAGDTIPSAYTFLGQFIDHDLTAFPVGLISPFEFEVEALVAGTAPETGPVRTASADGEAALLLAGALRRLEREATGPTRVDVTEAKNERTGTLDLDSVYGFGFLDAPQEDYIGVIEGTAGDPPAGEPLAWFEVEPGGSTTGRFVLTPVWLDAGLQGFDYRRDRDGTALIPDARNDENQLLAQVQTVIMATHNACMDELTAAGTSVAEAFAACRRDVTHLYQAIVATDYLVRLSQPEILQALRAGGDATVLGGSDTVETRFYGACGALPLEFAVAAFRLGHSQVRNGYRLNHLGGNRPIFGREDERDLSGGRLLERIDVIDWARFLAETGDPFRDLFADPLDPAVALRLYEMPEKALPGVPVTVEEESRTITDTPSERNLVRRNIARAAARGNAAGFTGAAGLIHGQAAAGVAKTQYPAVLTFSAADLDLPPNVVGTLGVTPLWIHVLGEAREEQNGERLGRLGTVIVGETILGSLACDETSVFNMAETAPTPSFSLAAQLREDDAGFTLGELIDHLEDEEGLRLRSAAP